MWPTGKIIGELEKLHRCEQSPQGPNTREGTRFVPDILVIQYICTYFSKCAFFSLSLFFREAGHSA